MQFLKCCFGCLTCFGTCHVLSGRVTFQPPRPPSYTFTEAEGKLKLLFRSKNGETSEPEVLTTVEDSLEFVVTSLGNRLPVYYLKHPDAKFTVLLSHGNSSDLGHMVYRAMDLVMYLNVSVVLYDYSGYGLSTGAYSEAATYADIRAAFAHVTEKLEIPWNRVILYGQSIGSGPTIDLAAGHPVGGVILHAPLASVLLIVARELTTSPKFDIFRNIEKIGQVLCPIFIIHGTADKIVPIRNSAWLLQRVKNPFPPWWVEGGDHNRLELDFRPEFFTRLRDFVSFLEEEQEIISPDLLKLQYTPRKTPTSNVRTVTPEIN